MSLRPHFSPSKEVIKKKKKKNLSSADVLWFSGRILAQFYKLKGKDILKGFFCLFVFNILNYCVAEAVTFTKSGWILCKWVSGYYLTL